MASYALLACNTDQTDSNEIETGNLETCLSSAQVCSSSSSSSSWETTAFVTPSLPLLSRKGPKVWFYKHATSCTPSLKEGPILGRALLQALANSNKHLLILISCIPRHNGAAANKLYSNKGPIQNLTKALCASKWLGALLKRRQAYLLISAIYLI